MEAYGENKRWSRPFRAAEEDGRKVSAKETWTNGETSEESGNFQRASQAMVPQTLGETLKAEDLGP